MEWPSQQQEQKEVWERLPRVVLHIMRHAEKASGNWNPDDLDHLVPLTEKGRQQSRAKHVDKSNPLLATAVGAPRRRTGETALHALVGERPDREDIVEYDELLLVADAGRKYGSRLLIDKRLGVPLVKQSELHAQLEQEAKQAGWLRAITDQYDAASDKGMTVYGMQAQNCANVILKYVQISRKWEKLVAEKSDAYVTDILEKYIGTQGGVLESFIGEFLQRVHGREARQTFIETFPDCIPFAEGCDIEIVPAMGGEPSLHLMMNIPREHEAPYVLDEMIPLDVLRAIAGDTHDKK